MSYSKLGRVTESNTTGTPSSRCDSAGRDGMQFMQLGMYGFISRPPAGSITVLMPLNGDDSNSVGITDDPDKGQMPELAEGECAIGNYAAGCYLHFRNDGTVYIKGKLIHDGDNEQTGTHTVTSGDVVADGVSLKQHPHPYTDNGVPMTTGAPNAG